MKEKLVYMVKIRELIKSSVNERFLRQPIMDYGSAVCEADRQYKKPEVREVNVEVAVFNVKGSYIQHVYGKSKDGPYV